MGATNEKSRNVALVRPVLLAAAILLLAGLDSYAEIPTDQISQFGGYGIVGALCVILGFVVWQREKEWSKRQSAWETERAEGAKNRLSDFKDLMTLVRENNVIIAQMNSSSEGRTIAVNGLTEAMKLQTAALQHLADTFIERTDRLSEIIERAARSNLELREALVSVGGLRPRQEPPRTP
jgi:hypothetical protein